MKVLILSSGHRVKLDDEDYEKVLHYLWRISYSYHDTSHGDILVVTPAKNKNGHSTHLLLPRLIMCNPPKDYSVKFKDGNRLNMQKHNLYLVRYCKLPNKKRKWLKEQAKPKRRPEHPEGRPTGRN